MLDSSRKDTSRSFIMIGREIKILDHGFVRLVDAMPNTPGEGDVAIVQAARVSYGKGTKGVRDDRNLIRYLMRHRHTSPFEMVEFKFHLKIPIFVARQHIRHRTANVNEYSARYSVLSEEFYLPDKKVLSRQSQTNKQGRSDEPFSEGEAEEIREKISDICSKSFHVYNELLEKDVARELARIVVPLSTYTEMYWKIDLHNLLHYIRLRMDHHAQYEIREVARAFLELIRPYVPLTVEAWEDYVLNSITFSKKELEAISEIINFDLVEKIVDKGGLSKGEKREFMEKLMRLREMKANESGS